MRTATPRAAASRNVPATRSPAGPGRRTSYRARSREVRASARNSATLFAISSTAWPPGASVNSSRSATGGRRRRRIGLLVAADALAGDEVLDVERPVAAALGGVQQRGHQVD